MDRRGHCSAAWAPPDPRGPSPREAQDALTPAGASRELTAPRHCPAQVCRGPELRPLPPPPARTCSGPVSGGALLSSTDPSFSRSTAGSQFKDSSALETSGNGLRPFLGPHNLQTTQACTWDAAQLGTGRHRQGSTQQWGTGPELSPWRRRQGSVASGSRAVQPPAHSGPH